MTCPHCGGRNIFRDRQTREPYCLQCGWRENVALEDDGVTPRRHERRWERHVPRAGRK